MNALLVDTPNYVLLDGKQRIGPELLALHSGMECFAIYGFSDKQPYDVFCANSQQALTPYPLVKGYLQNQLAVPGNAVHLVIVDATGPNEAHLNAVTMHSVLEAQEEKSNCVPVSFRLTRNEKSPAYRVEKASLGFVPEN